MTSIEVSSTEELCRAAERPGQGKIIVRGRILNSPSIVLRPGQELVGEGKQAGIEFASGTDGVQLTADNAVRGLALFASPECRAVFNDSSAAAPGNLIIESVQTIGQVQIVTEKMAQSGHVRVRDLDILHADTTRRLPQPQGFGVSVLEGAFTLWNRQGVTRLTAELERISIGRREKPANGGGVFLAGFAEDATDSLVVSLLTTGEIFTDGRIITGPPGSTVFISCAVGNFFGAHTARIENAGAVTTFGDFDMVLDNWGTVDRWVAEKPLTSHGKQTAIGFVNYGKVGELLVKAPVETFGMGSRGFNEYHGSLQSAEFDRITTHGDAAPGIQLSCPVGRLIVHGGIETHGGSGKALVSGKFLQLPAYGLDVTLGAEIHDVSIHGGIVTHGTYIPDGNAKDSVPVPIPAVNLSGQVGRFHVEGGILAIGAQTEPAEQARPQTLPG